MTLRTYTPPQSLPLLKAWGFLLLGLLVTQTLVHAESPPVPTVNIITLDRQASETGPDEGSCVVLRTGATNESLTVFYSVDGTAEPGIDYQELPGTVTIPPGFASAMIVVNPVDDLEVEGRETVVLAVVDPPGGETYVPSWPTRARIAIEDDDSEANLPPRVRITNPTDGSVFVGPESIALVAKTSDPDGFVKTVEFFDGATSLGVVTYPRPPSRDEIAANPKLLDDVVSRRLSELQSPSLDRPDRQVTPDLLEHPEAWIQVFRFRWTELVPGEHVLTALATDTDGDSTLSAPIVITIEKGPITPVVSVLAVDPIATEQGGIPVSDEEADINANEVAPEKPDVLRPNNAVFVIKRRAADVSEPLHVFYRVLGTAENGVDYRRIPHHVTIPAGAWAVRVNIRPYDDNGAEGRESVILKLVPQLSDQALRDIPGYYRVGNHGVARAVIIDNDEPSTNLPPAVRLVRPDNGDVFKAGSRLVLVAHAADRDGFIRSVEFFEGENSLGLVKNPLIRPVDALVKSMSVADKVSIQAQPLYRVEWKDVPEGAYVLTAVATDNKGEETVSKPVEIKVVSGEPWPVVTVVARDPVAEEGAAATVAADPTATFVVARRGGQIGRPLTVHYRIGGTAENGVDYREISGLVTIKPGLAKAKVIVAPIDDEICEGSESVIIKLIPSIHLQEENTDAVFHPYRVGQPDKARAVIRDDDTCPENQAPHVRLILPFNGMVFQAPVNVPVFALAGDVDGDVVGVGLYANETLIGRAVRIGPYFEWSLYDLEWENAPAGEFELTAVAVDDDGDRTRSRAVAIEVLTEVDSEVGAIDGMPAAIVADGVLVSMEADAVPAEFAAGSPILDRNGEWIERQSELGRDDVLANISARGLVKTGAKKMIAGFVITGTGTKQVLVRAIGPSLSSFGVQGALQNPLLEVFRAGAAAPEHINDDWSHRDPAGIRRASSRLGAFSLDDGSPDSVLLLDLPPGGYTAQVSGVADGIGVGLVEVYDGDDPETGTPTAEIVNISTRGEIGTAGDVLIAGFVINGSSPKRVLIRGIGPTLAGYGVSGTMGNPSLELFAADDGSSALTANDDWQDHDGDAIADAVAAIGGFPLEEGSADAAILIWLEPGAYTARMFGRDGGTGVGLIEVYQVP